MRSIMLKKVDIIKAGGMVALAALVFLSIVALRIEALLFFVNAAIWIAILFSISGNRIIERAYFLLFGIFFVLPPVILGGVDFLSVGALFQSISLDFGQTVQLEAAITLFMCSFFFAASASSGKTRLKKTPVKTKITSETTYLFVLVSSFFVIFSFNLLIIVVFPLPWLPKKAIFIFTI